MKYRCKHSDIWANCSDAHKTASNKAALIGEVLLSKARALPTYLYLNKQIKNPVKQNKKKRTNKHQHYADKAQKPWVIASSIKTDKAQAIMNPMPSE